MDHSRIAALLRPYHDALSSAQIEQVSRYLDKLILWNSRMNLTSIRDAEHIVTRHFGESLFLASHLSARGWLKEGSAVYDIGSGSGFPGIPLKIACPEIDLTLVEAHGRKAVFLKEALRAANLDGKVENARAEDLAAASSGSADVVTLRAVEKFEAVLPGAAQFVRPGGVLALLIGKEQVSKSQDLLKTWVSGPLSLIPGTESRGILLMNHRS